MARNFGARMLRIHPTNPFIYKPQQSTLVHHANPIAKTTQNRRFSLLKMDKIMGFGPPLHSKKSEETNDEPSLKLQKLDQHHNGLDSAIAPASPAAFLKVKKLSDKAVIPTRGSPLAAGYDLSSAVDTKVPARGKALVATELSIAIPEGTYARIAPRSGLAWKHSIDVGAGVIDADYRGPVGVILFNHSDAEFEVKAGDRIAQLIIEKIITPEVFEVEDLDSTVRGAGGFGSTGV